MALFFDDYLPITVSCHQLKGEVLALLSGLSAGLVSSRAGRYCQARPQHPDERVRAGGDKICLCRPRSTSLRDGNRAESLTRGCL
ncbi:unnamed protein product [Leuciscus chuanchicus]